MISVEGSQEELALEKFRLATADLNQDDVTLLRFLRAREHDLSKAEDLLRKALKWRQEINVSTYLNWKPTSGVLDDMVFQCTGRDKSGRPVIWLPMGRWNTRTLVENGFKEDVAKFRYHLLENIMRHIRNSKASQVIVIFGIEQLTYWKIANIETMQILHASLKDLQLHYPEILYKIMIINAPWFFPVVYNFIKPILTSRSTSKMHMFSSDKAKWLPALLEYIPKESLPDEYLE